MQFVDVPKVLGQSGDVAKKLLKCFVEKQKSFTNVIFSFETEPMWRKKGVNIKTEICSVRSVSPP